MIQGFSVLMSVYAKEAPNLLFDSLNSVLDQSVAPSEIVLVEDGPLTEELNLLIDTFKEKCKTLKLIKIPKNRGLGLALNEGLKHCKYELVARMDTDDISKPDRFEKQLGFMRDHPDIDACSSWIDEFIETPDNVVSIKKLPASNDEISRYIKLRSPLNHPAVMFRKSAVEKAGGYMHFPLFEDWYLWARMFKCGSRFANIQESLLFFRTSNDMFKRRGGIKYTINSIRFQHELYKLGVINIYQAVKSSVIRGFVYMMPNAMRTLFYKKFLRG